jgi:hypothetical protein
MKEHIQVLYRGEDISSSVMDYKVAPLIHGVNCTQTCNNTYMIQPDNVSITLADGTIIETNLYDCTITVFCDEDQFLWTVNNLQSMDST